MSSKREMFEKIVANIKSIKIQGANNVARAALAAYSLIPTEKSKKILLDSRPTEPMMQKVLQLAKKTPSSKDIKTFSIHTGKNKQFCFKPNKKRQDYFYSLPFNKCFKSSCKCT